MPGDTQTILCPAKVNLALSVGTPDAKTGMHPICSWMVAVDSFGDTLTLTRAGGDESSFDILQGEGAPAAIEIDWPLEQDLAYRAHAMMQAHTGRHLPIDAVLEKRVPSYAGLGGGSSDAAGMLVGLNDLFSLGLPEATLLELGMRLGSDVGFLVKAQLGMSSAIVSGYGGEIEPAALRDTLHLVLVPTPVRCSTPEVYNCFDRLSPSARVDPDRVRGLAASSVLQADGPFNDLAEAAYEAGPLLRDLRGILSRSIEMPVHVSGSGSSLFVVAKNPDDAWRLRDRLCQDVHALPVVTTVRG